MTKNALELVMFFFLLMYSMKSISNSLCSSPGSESLVIKPQMMLMMPGVVADFARSLSFSSSIHTTWSNFFASFEL